MLLGVDVYGATLGIIGLGRIGAAVAKRAIGFDMKVIYHSRNRRSDIENDYGFIYKENLDDRLGNDRNSRPLADRGVLSSSPA